MVITLITLSALNRDNIKSISQNYKDPSWIAEVRESAFSKYESLPSEVSALYTKYSDVKRLKPDMVRIQDGQSSFQLNNELNARLKELERGAGLLRIGDAIEKKFLPEELTEQGIIISDLSDAFAKYPDLVKKQMSINQLDYEEDRFLALELAAFRSGVFIYVPRNVVIKDPIRIVNSLGDDGSSSIARNMIIMETGSKATVVQELYASSDNDQKNNDYQQAYIELMETHVSSNAHLELVTLQAMDKYSVNISNRKAFVERDGKMSWYLGMFGGQLARYKIDSIMKGPGASAEDVEIIFGVEDQSFDVTSNLIHYGPNSRGRVLVKSVLKDKSKSLFKGMIRIGKQAKGSESYLAGHAVLLDKGAKSDTIPGLEIETNEVKATHAASVAQLDEMLVFYLMTRGLSREGAKREIVSGFLEPLSRKMGPNIRAWVNYLIENKWSGKPLMLRSDEAMDQILEVEKSRYKETQDIFEKHYKYR